MSVKSTSQALEPTTGAPLGAHHDGGGASFALFSGVAEAVELCLFDDSGNETRRSLEQGDGFVWQGYLPGVAAGPALRLSRAWPVGPGCGRSL